MGIEIGIQSSKLVSMRFVSSSNIEYYGQSTKYVSKLVKYKKFSETANYT